MEHSSSFCNLVLSEASMSHAPLLLDSIEKLRETEITEIDGLRVHDGNSRVCDLS